MAEDSFSRRYGYGPQKSDLIYEDAPEQVRVGLREVLKNCDYDTPSSQRAVICAALRKRPDPSNWSEYPNINEEVDELIHGCEWFVFYDMCERIAQNTEMEVEYFNYEFNELLKEERVGYQIQEGKLEKIGSEEFNQAVSESRIQLGDPRFVVASKQFEKALDFRNSMPPDYPNAVKEAVNALEGTLQVVLNMKGTALPTLLSNLEPPLPSSLKKLYDGLYAYGSASEGARHASIGGHVSTAEEAELIIHTVAAAIRYATKTYG